MDSRDFYFEYCNLINSINTKYDNYAKRFGVVSSNLFWLLYALNDNKPHTQLELSEHCGLPKTTINTIIKDLEKQGYIVLVQGADKRERIITYTSKGQEYANSVLSDLFNKENKLFNNNKKNLVQLIENLKEFDNLLKNLEI